ncbi:MAG: hypothetical protein IKB61_00895 [Elusimicrobiaceae bacterium]|nr:hypothetical protein [Elusimicrobiaceae bacterium]MBR2504483.1 hypothetical protein [Elusimicrobiaceae bacterium]MBR5609078.1 hypothetical protein [Elusimicrobiaceae bacterium]
MSISVVKQYSVFIPNEPGALKKFANLFTQEKASLIAISQDVRFDSAVVRAAVNYNANVSHALTKAGYTSVKTDAICIDTPDRVGVVTDIGDVLHKKDINITTIYGACCGHGHARFVIVVSDIAQALNALESSGLF